MKKSVGVLMGGYSSEKGVSMKSGMAVFESLPRDVYVVHALHITREGWWLVRGDEKFAIDKNDFSALTPEGKITFDVLFNAVHGTPGEDGLLQAYFRLLDIPHTSSGHFESALTFNKVETSSLLNHFGVNIAPAYYLMENEPVNTDEILKAAGSLPVFVKPNRSGSSFGVSKVKTKSELPVAIQKAFEEDSQIIIEKAITGTELACGLARIRGEIKVLGITEIVPKNEFFDFAAKYEGKAEEITPARISEALTNKIAKESKFIYESLNMSGIARVDYIVEKDTHIPFLIEVNSVPGLSKESIVPQQITYTGFSLDKFYALLIEEALKNPKK